MRYCRFPVTSESVDGQLPAPSKPADFQEACPFLGLQRDPATRARQPTTAHRCYRDYRQPRAISEEHQLAFCLTGAFPECTAYPNGWGRPVERRVQPGSAIGRVLLLVAGSASIGALGAALWLLLA